MKSKYLLISLMVLFQNIYAQVGIGTPTPRGALDINKPTTHNMGLVLPTNSSTGSIINPQGGNVAEGTMIYDSTMKCVKVFNGTTWSNCLCDACTTTPTIVADCTASGFQGTYTNGISLTGASFSLTLTNNSFSTATIGFQTSDLVLSGVGGITVSSVSPATATLNAGQSQIITYNLSGTPASSGTLTGTWSKLSLSCSNSKAVGKTVRFAYWSTYSIGSTEQAIFNSQLSNTANYGSTGIYSGNFNGFAFTNITSTLSTLTVANLLSSYDIICTGYSEMTTADAAKIKGFVDGGGVAIILFDSNIGTTLFNAFGGAGSVGSGVVTATTNSNAINNGIFGNTTNITINGQGTYGVVSTSQLPSGSTILATNGTSAQIFIAGNQNKAIFIWDEGIFRDTSVVGTVVDTPQERFLHNIVAYALSKAGF
ncbi:MULTISPECIES: hypothetical protein [unclassified Chryseobacterium]|uniref:hypothetical protein n=1 Tax=unclassified Chryseobacterium TaxID=2593645 RepID=UPI000D37E041|nr:MULTISPECIES: hypothetical protein [unclassified Chryseobacterium]PTT75120.1 hypothetical protein DBR25_09080 [Chryseobacterium sp. HMWF001]PVV56067.1 hypothetical protein DD829_12120 [Chryseobacterium sp. HMWF035]